MKSDLDKHIERHLKDKEFKIYFDRSFLNLIILIILIIFSPDISFANADKIFKEIEDYKETAEYWATLGYYYGGSWHV